MTGLTLILTPPTDATFDRDKRILALSTRGQEETEDLVSSIHERDLFPEIIIAPESPRFQEMANIITAEIKATAPDTEPKIFILENILGPVLRDSTLSANTLLVIVERTELDKSLLSLCTTSPDAPTFGNVYILTSPSPTLQEAAAKRTFTPLQKNFS